METSNFDPVEITLIQILIILRQHACQNRDIERFKNILKTFYILILGIRALGIFNLDRKVRSI